MGKRSFSKWLDSSPNTVHGLSVYGSDLTFSGVIIDDKDKESKKTKLLNVDLSTSVALGDIIVWDDEKWIVFSKEHMTREIYQAFTMIKCNQLLKWIDEEGHIVESYAYFVGTLDSTIKELFRTWSSVVVPKPNKAADMIMPLHDLKKMTRFIINEEAWFVVDYDKSSVKNVMYVSLLEDSKNEIDDTDEIADIDRLAKYDFVIADAQEFEVGEEIDLAFYVKKDGIALNNIDTFYTFPDNEVVGYVDEILTAQGVGTVEITIHLKDYPEVVGTCSITVGDSHSVSSYLQGNSSIKVGRIGEYQLVTSSSAEVSYSLNNEVIAKIKKVENGKCYIQANENNKLGDVVLTATQDGVDYSMTISIIPLW